MVIRETIRFGRQLLEDAGISDADTDAGLLFEAVTGRDRTYRLLHPEEEIPEEQMAEYRNLLERRAAHEPCQYIIGSCEFYGLTFEVNPNVLIPRQDTEVLVEEALKEIPKEACVLDLCTGSGAIAVALKHSRNDLQVIASDLSEKALDVAKRNGDRNGCEISFLQSDLFEKIDPAKQFDLIVSNPPYVTDAEYEELMPEVKEHEPKLALTAGAEGLDIYKRLISEAPNYLKPEGRLMVEIGYLQGESVRSLYEANGFREIRIIKDLAGLDRVVAGKLLK